MRKPTIKEKSILKSKKDLTDSYIVANPKPKRIYTNERDTSGTYFVTGCAHVPFQNKKMYNSVFNFLSKEIKLQGIVLAGDIMDLNSLSSHDKGKIPLPGITLDYEYKEGNKFLNEIDSLGAKSVDFIYGNHSDRYNRYIKDVDVAKLGTALKSPIEALNLEERKYGIFTNWKNDHIKLGHHLEINHGEFCNVHTAKKTIDTYRKSTMYFHTHRLQIYTEGMVGGFNMGFGGDLNSPAFGYATRAMLKSWTNACALVHLDREGFFHVQPLVYMNSKLFVNGKSY
jgi:hypothetical protein